VHVADPSEVSRLVRAGASGSETAWNELVRRYSPLVMAVTRTYQLTADDARDVSQTVWLRLVENLANLREPDALPGWLATTTQRECIRQLRQGRRMLPVDPHTDGALQLCETMDPDTGILRAELHQALRDGLAELPARDQELLKLRAADPPKSYEEISQLLGMPVGSIGPTLRRSLDRLRETSAMRAYLAAPAADERKGGGQRVLAGVD
jgi:RNA polymerase sigma factor (sigma-70 family)